MHDIDRALRLQTPSSEVRDYIYSIKQKSRHIEYIEIGQLARRDQERSNSDLRLRYLTNHISRDELKRQLLLRERKRDKEIALRDVYELFIDVTNDILLTLIADATPTATVVEEMKKIVEYTNASLKNVKARFKCNAYTININTAPPS